MDQEIADRILGGRESATAEEVEVMAGCLSRESLSAMHLEMAEDALAGGALSSLSGGTSACFVDQLDDLDRTDLLATLIQISPREALVLGYDREAMELLDWTIGWSLFVCLNKTEWTAVSTELGIL